MKHVSRALWLALVTLLLAVPAADAQGPVDITVTQIDQSSDPQIAVYVSATDPAGNPVRNLAPEAFRLEQNGQPVQLQTATRAGEQGPVSTVLIVDHSGSMAFAGKMAGAQQAAANFINQMRPGDQVALVQFDSEIETLQALTTDKGALLAAVQKLTPRGNTALYDALAQGGKYLEAATGRKAIIVVTDGMDNASKLNRDASLAQAAQGGYSVYTVGLGNKGAGTGSQEGIDETTLRDLANASLGTYVYAPDASQLGDIYQQLSLRIQNEYKLTYISPDALRDGVKRDIVVTAPGAVGTHAAYNPGGLIPEVAPQLSSWVLFAAALVLLVALFFLPIGLGLVKRRLMPSKPPSRVRLIDGAPSKVPATPVVRIKVGKKPRIAPTRPEMPWDEGAPKH